MQINLLLAPIWQKVTKRNNKMFVKPKLTIDRIFRIRVFATNSLFIYILKSTNRFILYSNFLLFFFISIFAFLKG